MQNVADEMNRILPEPITTQFKDVSIVEIGFMGNVLREFYRINLADGTAFDAASGKAVRIGIAFASPWPGAAGTAGTRTGTPRRRRP